MSDKPEAKGQWLRCGLAGTAEMTSPEFQPQETKLYVPLPPKRAVERKQLHELLSESISERQVTLIEAPAGSGKTTALASWVAAEQPDVAWVSLDERDDREERFLALLMTAVGRLSGSPLVGDGRLLDEDGREELLEDLLRSLEALESQTHLVLDDYHFVQSVGVHEVVARLVEAAPAALRIVIASRTSPPLPLGRWRARLQLGEIGADDLRFAAEEASDLVREVSGVELSSQSVEALNWRTEGWVAGLQLAALSIRSSHDPEQFVESFSGDDRHVLDFLLEEVWAKLDEGLRGHLMRLSLSHRFCAGLCDALSGEQDGQEVLDQIDRDNLFLVPLDHRRDWFRFHRLFADFLKRQLSRSTLDSRVLHERAADWFSEHRDAYGELEHRYRAEDWQRFALAVVAHQRQVWTYPPDDWFGKAVLEVPDEEALENQTFLALLVTYLITVAADIPSAMQKLQLLDQATVDQGPAARAPLLATRGYLLAIRGDDDEAVAKLARGAIESSAPDDVTTRSRARLAMAIAALSKGDALEAEELLSRECTIERREASYFTFLGALVRRAQAALELGRLDLAMKRLDELEVERRRRGRVPIVLRQILLGRALLHRADFTGCEQALTSAFALSEEGREQFAHEAHVLSARLHRCRGELEMARRTLEEAVVLATKRASDRRLREARAFATVVALELGDSVEVDAWLDDIDSTGYCVNPLVEERERLTLARIHLEAGQANRAREAFQPALDRARQQGRQVSVVEGLCLEALAASVEHQLEGAAEVLDEALDLARQERVRLPFVELQKDLLPILTVVTSSFDPLVRVRSTETQKRTRKGHGPDEPLSERELEVLEELLSGSSNDQIAANLFVSRNTVKTHLRNIYAKLGAHNRTQAAAQARAFGLATSG